MLPRREPPASRPAPALFLALALALLSACAGESEPAATSGAADAGTDGCRPGELSLDDGRCLAAGMQDNGCAAGEAAVDGGSNGGGACRPAGIPPGMCGQGFAPDGEAGCAPILPVEPCPAGLMAVPGETRCREVAPCGAGTWGDIPVEANTEHVDLSYQGGGSDGTAAKPWTTMQAGIDAAAPGAIVAVAAGSYVEDVVLQGQSARLWGRCPEMVEIVGTAVAAVSVAGSGAGSEIRDLALAGAGAGLLLSGAAEVKVDRVRVHDTADRGLLVLDGSGITVTRSLVEAATVVGVVVLGSEATLEATVVRETGPSVPEGTFGTGIDVEDDAGDRATLTLRSTVIEHNQELGVFIWGSDATIESSVVRDTRPQAADQRFGRGIAVQDHAGQRGSLTLRTSVVAENHDFGLFVQGSDATVEGSVVRDTQPQASDQGYGLGIGVAGAPGQRASVDLIASVIARNHEVGVLVVGSNATIESTIVRETRPRAQSQRYGRGIGVQNDTSGRAAVFLRSSLVDQNRDVGVFVAGSDTTVESTIVRGTQPQASDLAFGWGIGAQEHTGERASLTVRASIVDANTDIGVLVTASDATIESTVVKSTQPQASDLAFGVGIGVQLGPETMVPSSAAIRGSLVEHNRSFGIVVLGSDATVDGTAVRDTQPSAQNGSFGDGIAARIDDGGSTSATVTASLVENSGRAAVSSFGALVSVAGTVLECNAIDLDGEVLDAKPASWKDEGDNVCGCAGETVPCQVRSMNLTPPEPIASEQ